MQIGGSLRDDIDDCQPDACVQVCRTFRHERFPVRRAIFVRGAHQFDGAGQLRPARTAEDPDFDDRFRDLEWSTRHRRRRHPADGFVASSVSKAATSISTPNWTFASAK
jgi:hypothetical protein